MKLKPLKLAPAIIAVIVITLVSLARVCNLAWIQRLEHMTYDKRVRSAQDHPQVIATNLGFVFISDNSIVALNNGSLHFRYGLYWPRHIYGRVMGELSDQGARVVGFDVMFPDRRFDHASVKFSAKQKPDLGEFLRVLHPGETPPTFEEGGEELTLVESDEYFAWQIRRSGIGVVAAEKNVLPDPLFATNAIAQGDISAEPDADGVLRRAMAFRNYTNWHFLFRQVEADPGYGVNLSKAKVTDNKIVLPRQELPAIEVPIDTNGQFELADFVGEKLPAGLPAKAKPFTVERVWHMGIVLAAHDLGLDLDRAEVKLAEGKIVFHGRNRVERILPVDTDGSFYINWEITPTDPRLTSDAIERVLALSQARNAGAGDSITNIWRDKLVVVGSAATGNDLTDHGATPLEKDTLLASKHWNVANSIITGRFVRTTPLAAELLLIALLSTLTALLTWQLRAVTAALAVAGLVVAYSVVVLMLYSSQRIWLPVILPVGGAFLMQYVSLQTYRVVFEQREQRRVKSVFSRVVSPDVANELLSMETLSLGGARREVTVLFADVRGFTELTDIASEHDTEFIRAGKLSSEDVENLQNETARQTLVTVNLYLATVADMVKRHHGTLDKYIGDCVMAFWGAPVVNPKHAIHCVRAAIEAQRAIHQLNEQRSAENRRIEAENPTRIAAGQPPKPLLPTLYLGTGINSGRVTVGLMGSDAHILNYTVFGREVNLASRLESVSGRGRIIIGESTYLALLQDDSELAATCIEQEPTKPKGFQKPVRNYEVPWQNAAS